MMDNVAKTMNTYPNYKAEIIGNADNTGDKLRNETLSQQRADALKAYLIKKGIAESRISTKGMGDGNPAGDNATSSGRTMNRRAEIKIEY